MTFYKIIRKIAQILLKLLYRIKIHGIENIPNTDKLIICSNHINLLDPPVLAVIFKRPVSFMAKKELFKNKIIATFLTKLGSFPVNRDGNDITAIKNALKVLNKGNILGIFPEGTRVTEFDEENAKAGVAMLAVKSKSPILPILIKSKYKIFGKIDIYIGNPIEFDEYYNNKLSVSEYTDISKSILKTIYSLENNN